jgi:hypothetical protein
LTIAALIFSSSTWVANAGSDIRHVEQNVEELKQANANRNEMDRKRDEKLNEKLTDIQIKVGILISRDADKANQH